MVDGGEAGGGSAGAVAREAVRARVGRWLVQAGRRAWTPRGLLVMLASCSLAPLLTSGVDVQQLELLGTATAAGVGGNTLSGLLAEAAEHLDRHKATPGTLGAGEQAAQVRAWLEQRFTAVLEAGGTGQAALEAELAVLVTQVGAGQEAVQEAMRLGQVQAADQMREALSGIGAQVAGLGAVMDQVAVGVRRLLELAESQALLAAGMPGFASGIGTRLRRGVVGVAPRWVVARGQTGQVVAAVLDARSAGVVGVTGVTGAGGFGKSTVAQMVCADPRVRGRFGPRVYWVTIGLDCRSGSQVAAKVAEVTVLVTGDGRQFTDPQAAGAHLMSQVEAAGEPVLLVLDDVWEIGQLAPFLHGAPDCVRLVTTRISDLLPPGAARVLVDRLEPSEARAVLTEGLSGLPAGVVESLVGVCGRWALLLRLANRWIAKLATTGGDPARYAEDLLARLRTDPTATAWPDAAADPRDQVARNTLVQASVQASTSLLSPRVARCFVELGVFPADEPIPIRVLARLWGTDGWDEAAVRRACVDIERLALATIDPGQGGAMVLHDVLHAYARHTLAQDGTLAQVADRLITAVQADLPLAPAVSGERVPAWWTLDPRREGYLLDHAVDLLVAAGQHQCAAALAGDLRWVAARVDERGANSAITDLTSLADAGDRDATARVSELTRVAHLLIPDAPGHGMVNTLHSYLQPLPTWSAQADAMGARPASYARLLNACPPPDLPSPAMIRTLIHTSAVCALVVAPDGTWLASGDVWGVVRIWDPTTGTELRTLTGHASRVCALVVAPDGTWLATSSEDRTVRIWDPTTGTELRTLASHTDVVRALVVAPDGTWLAASGGYDGVVRIWDPTTGTELRTLTGHAGKVPALVVAPDGTWLATSSSYDGAVRIWDPTTGTELHTLTSHTDEMDALVVAPDGTWLASGGEDRTVRIWDPTTGTELRTLTGHASRVDMLVVAPDGTWLATSSEDRTVRIWDPTTGTELHTLTSHTDVVRALVVAPDGTWLAASGGYDGAVRIWDPTTGTELHTLTSHIGYASVLVVAPDTTWLASGGYDAAVMLWDLTTGAELRTAAGYTSTVDMLVVAPDGTWLAASGGYDGAVRIWDPTTGTELHTLTGHTRAVHVLVVAPDGTWLATGDGGGVVRIWDPTTGTELRTLTGHIDVVRVLVVAPDGTWLASGGDDGVVRIWDPTTGTELHTLTGHTSRVRALAVAPDGTWLASGGDDGVVRIWDPTTGTELHTLTGHTRQVDVLVVAPDGTWLASGGHDGVVRIWDPTTGTELHILTGHIDAVRVLVVAPDGTWLATTGNGDGAVRIWDPTTGTELHTLTGHTDKVRVLAVAPDGTWLATSGENRAMRIWDAMAGRCIAAINTNSRIEALAWSSGLVVAAGPAGIYAYHFAPIGTAATRGI